MPSGNGTERPMPIDPQRRSYKPSQRLGLSAGNGRRYPRTNGCNGLPDPAAGCCASKPFPMTRWPSSSLSCAPARAHGANAAANSHHVDALSLQFDVARRSCHPFELA